MNKNIFSYLIGETILSIENIIVFEKAINLELLDSLVFKTSHSGSYQLLISQTRKTFRKLSSGNDIELDGEYDEDYIITFSPLNNPLISKIPFEVLSVVEFWAGCGENQFLFGAAFYGKEEKTLLSMCLGGDEIQIISYPKLWEISQELLPVCQEISINYYDEKKSNRVE
jgi:hypothetical protein